MRPLFSLLALLLAVALFAPAASAGGTTDLGAWDDAFAFDDADFLVLRRGEDVFSFSPSAAPRPKKLATIPAMASSEIVYGAQCEERMWLFCQSREGVPFAVDVTSGRLVSFVIPGLTVPGDRTATIQSWVMAPHLGSVVLMVSGGDSATWPRDGNRPVYFWFDLRSGKSVQLPLGWDLEFLSSDLSVAVFAKPQEVQFQRRPLAGVDMKTGKQGSEVPDRQKSAWAPFNWTATAVVRPLAQARRPGEGDTELFEGVSFGGRPYAFHLALQGEHYISSAQVREGWIALRLRRSGDKDVSPSPLWVGPLRNRASLMQVEQSATDFALLGPGKCVVVTAGHSAKRDSSEAFVWDTKLRRATNVLDGIQRLPALEPQYVGKEYIADGMNARIVRGIGDAAGPGLALCLFSHTRGDLRAHIPSPDEKLLPWQNWRRAILVTADGRRREIEALRDVNEPYRMWLLNSGWLVAGDAEWSDEPSGKVRRIRLRCLALDPPP